MIIAGEASGDLYAANLVEKIMALNSSYHFFGIGGEKTKKARVEILIDSKELAVTGLTELVGKLKNIYLALKETKKALKKRRPKLLILIDFPDFNLRIAKVAKKLKIPVLYYISPQIWAWRKGRIKTIAKFVDKMIVILPFEEPIYKEYGVDVAFVGHPLIDLVKHAENQKDILLKWGLNPDIITITLMPGSRTNEVKRLLPIMILAANKIAKKFSNLQFIIPTAPTISKIELQRYIPKNNLKIKIVENDTYNSIYVAKLIITASGTATLEAAILSKPMIIIYKLSFLSYLLGRMLLKIPMIGLVNILANKMIVPELLQNQANPLKIAKEAERFLKDKKYYLKVKNSLQEIRSLLGPPGASERAARVVINMIN